MAPGYELARGATSAATGESVEPGAPHPKATDWHDDAGDFRTNEIAINWNAALVYALAAFLPK